MRSLERHLSSGGTTFREISRQVRLQLLSDFSNKALSRWDRRHWDLWQRHRPRQGSSEAGGYHRASLDLRPESSAALEVAQTRLKPPAY